MTPETLPIMRERLKIHHGLVEEYEAWWKKQEDRTIDFEMWLALSLAASEQARERAEEVAQMARADNMAFLSYDEKHKDEVCAALHRAVVATCNDFLAALAGEKP